MFDVGVDHKHVMTKKLGVISEQLEKNLEGLPELFTTIQHVPSTVLLTAANTEANKFICTAIPLDDCRVIAFCEEPPRLKPIMEYADRDTFVRMFNRAGRSASYADVCHDRVAGVGYHRDGIGRFKGAAISDEHLTLARVVSETEKEQKSHTYVRNDLIVAVGYHGYGVRELARFRIFSLGGVIYYANRATHLH